MAVKYDPKAMWTTWGATIEKTKFNNDLNSAPDGKQLMLSKVECYPLYSLMLATSLTVVDFLALDVEGIELQVLSTLPWEKIYIGVCLMRWFDF
jgi:FkbM family methyltransferase